MILDRSKCVPFVNTATDAHLATLFYGDAEIVRLNLHSFDDLNHLLPSTCDRWLDAGTDGLVHDHLADKKFKALVECLPHSAVLRTPQFQLKPVHSKIRDYVDTVLDMCNSKAPAWISIPQLPYADDAGRNKINRCLADCSRTWKQRTRSRVRLLLPVILSHRQQTLSKTVRNRKVQLASDCYERAAADGYWIVDHTLNDADGSPASEKRIASLVRLQEELEGRMGANVRTRVAGPYWGLGLLLWARGLTEHLGVGLGNAYTYYLPGGYRSASKKRVPLRHLHRLATAHIDLAQWLTTAAEQVATSSASAEFRNAAKHMQSYMVGDTSRRQIAEFHRNWYDTVANVPAAGRPLALYQNLSSAYVLGKPLDRLPASEVARRPESVARLLMMNCL